MEQVSSLRGIRNHGRDKGLRAVEASHLFAPNVTRSALRRGPYLRSYAYRFIEQFAPDLKRAEIDRAVHDDGEAD